MGKGVLIGVRNLHYAIMKTDDKTGATYEVPVKVAGVRTIDVKPSSGIDTLYGDDAPFDVADYLGDISVSVDAAQVPLNDLAALLGHTVNKGVMEYKSTDTPPYVALLFESVKSNGQKRFVKLLKGKFAEPEENFQGKDTSTHWNTVKLTGHFVVREYDSAWKRVADEDAADYESTTGDGWYNTVDSTVGG
nr:MAG TPA: tail tube protein [Caudoviricetes sp.]